MVWATNLIKMKNSFALTNLPPTVFKLSKPLHVVVLAYNDSLSQLLIE